MDHKDQDLGKVVKEKTKKAQAITPMATENFDSQDSIAFNIQESEIDITKGGCT